MTYGEAIAAFCRIQREHHPYSAEPEIRLSDTHFFYLGDDADFTSAKEDILDDLRAECSDYIPLPFRDITTISSVQMQNGTSLFVADRLVELLRLDRSLPYDVAQLRSALGKCNGVVGTTALSRIALQCAIACLEKGRHLSQVFVHEHYSVGAAPCKDAYLCSVVGYAGNTEDNRYASVVWSMQSFDRNQTGCNTLELEIAVTETLAGVYTELAAISHPMNYIVRATPQLTSREQRRKEAGKLNTAKTPHFIVVSHDVLVEMRSGTPVSQESDIDRASPIPHHRRGHWARLAERCRHARLLGRVRVFRRPTFVGDTRWNDTRNYYEVLPCVNSSTEGVAWTPTKSSK